MRAYELFINAVSNTADKDKFYELAQNAILSNDTSNEEIGLMLSRYDIQSHLGLSIIINIIDCLIKQNRLLELHECIYEYISSIAALKNIRPIELILELTISNNGVTRIIGRKLIDSFKVTSEEFNIISCSEDQQIKFLISLTQDWISGEIRIPLIMPILNTDSTKVRNWFLIVMQTYSLNYYGLIVAHLKKHSFSRTKELHIYEEFLKMLGHRFEIYHNCPELYSEYYFHDIFEEAKRSEKEYLQDVMEDIQNQKYRADFLEFIPSITLGRGGGWRQSDGTVHPLEKIAVSTSSPMLLSAQSPLEEFMQSSNIYSNWNSTNEI